MVPHLKLMLLKLMMMALYVSMLRSSEVCCRSHSSLSMGLLQITAFPTGRCPVLVADMGRAAHPGRDQHLVAHRRLELLGLLAMIVIGPRGLS